jgi:hypothetical protein
MKKQIVLSVLIALFGLFIFNSCGNKSDNTPPPKTKTQLLTQANWKFKSATIGGADATGQVQACQRDNVLTFLSNGNGSGDEGATKCNAGDPQTYTFTWNFASGETVIHTSSPLFTNGATDFTLVSLTEAELVVQMLYTPPVGPAATVVITFIH